MKSIYGIIAIVLIGLLIYVLWPRETVVVDNGKVKELQTKLHRAETKRTEIIVKARQDSVLNSEKEKVYKSEISRLKGRAKAQKEKPEVMTVLNNNAEVGKYAAYLDSIVVTQDLRIDSLNKEKVEQWKNFNKLISASDSTAQANKELNEFVNKALEVENKRLKRQNRALKVGIVAIPLAVVAIVIAK
jgi:hypothetical protein